MILSVILCAMIWIHDQNRPVYIPAIASGLMLAVGVCLSLLLGNLIAAQQNSRLLSVLHMELDPESFVRSYKHIPSGITNKASRAIACSYLADGYCAMGQWDLALNTMCSDFTDKKGREILSLRCLYYNNCCSYLILKGDTVQAKETLEQLKSSIQTAEKENPALAKNMKESLCLYENWLRYLDGQTADTAFLTKAIAKCRFRIRRLEMQYLLALTFLREQRRKEALSLLEQIQKEGGKHYLKKEAGRLMETV